MTAAVAPAFAARYPEAAIIFDNLHSMHDVVSDILANPNVTRGEKRARILEAARRYRDNSSFVMTVAEWRDMAQMIGVENMGGASVGFLATFPKPTVERGAVMAGMDHSRMHPSNRDSSAIDHSKMDHAKMAGDSGKAGAVDNARMNMAGMRDSADAAHSRLMMDLFMRLMADPAIRARVLTDTATRRTMTDMIDEMPA